ncbi:phosphate transport system regulatory protein Ph oU [Desulfonema ishimotonii]|uniref:Phosphate-specific transport system accessory protein PhoU n=1 Tax=Desulfonema ishimotonii TaxID=45657 RepID=A0A401FRN2_9BACT|nr:phosphate signaling complex protein PhoU [Desulfonema ishimotonii]GBC59627.1 phosphate transport system regulatory protein Ph oU [Desulfonema ishimotonii]
MAKHFQKELDKLKQRILALGAQVEDRLRLAGKAIESREIFDAERIIKSDHEIDAEEVEIEEECLKVMALYQPVAVDLRFLIATIKINSELERIGDEAVNIAWRVKTIIKKNASCDIMYDYTSMIEQAEVMLNSSLDALVNMDVDLAFRVLTLDDGVDQLHNTLYHQAMKDLKAHPDSVPYIVNLFWISRHLERIADHATNIAEEVIYLVEGEIVRHQKY